MFDMRLGLALGKTVGEIHAMSYPEYKRWQLFYNIEPFGFVNDEFRFSAIMSQIYNAQVGKQNRVKKPTYWMRNMIKGFFDFIVSSKKELDNELDLETEEGKRLAEARALVAFDIAFGGKLLDNKLPRKKK